MMWHSETVSYIPKSRRDKTAVNKDFTCPYPRCERNYYDKRSLVRHCKEKHDLNYHEFHWIKKGSKVESTDRNLSPEFCKEQCLQSSQDVPLNSDDAANIEVGTRKDSNSSEAL